MQSDRDTEPNTSLRDSELSENEGLPGFSLFPDGPIFAETESGERERRAVRRGARAWQFRKCISASLKVQSLLSLSLSLSSNYFRSLSLPPSVFPVCISDVFLLLLFSRISRSQAFADKGRERERNLLPSPVFLSVGQYTSAVLHFFSAIVAEGKGRFVMGARMHWFRSWRCCFLF